VVAGAPGPCYTGGVSSDSAAWRPGRPRDHFASREAWRSGLPAADSPIEVLYASQFAAGLRLYMDEQFGQSLTGTGGQRQALAAHIGLNAETLRQIIEGRRWPSLIEVARAESRLGRELTGRSVVVNHLSDIGQLSALSTAKSETPRMLVRRAPKPPDDDVASEG
jgi:hypothetical protein